VRGEIAYDVAYYLTVSEQVPSALILGTALEPDGAFSASGGILIQGLPGTSPETLEKIEANIADMKAPLGEMLKGGEDILSAASELVDGASLEVLGDARLTVACRCSRAMLAQIIRGIPPDDIGSMLEKDRVIELTCTFCTTQYRFEEQEVRALFAGRLNA
jgi:molecular chaperone Hsp33